MFKNNWQLHFHEVSRIMRDAEFDPHSWNRILEYVGRVIGASSGAMAIRDRTTLALRDPVGTTWSGEALAVYLDHERPLEADPMLVELTREMFRQPTLKSFSSLELLDVPGYLKSGFFNEFADRFEIPYLTGTCFELDSTNYGAWFFHRPLHLPEFDRDERQFLEALTPLISLGLRYRPLQRQLLTARGVLDQINLAVVMLDEMGRFTHMNRRAEQFIERSRALAIRAGRLVSPWPDVAAELARACFQATRARPPQPAQLFIPDTHDRRVRADSPRSFTQVVVLPMSEESSVSLWRECVPAVLFLCHSDDPASSLLDAESVLQRGFGCSPTQARIGALYTIGVEITGIAMANRMSISTVRKHIRSVLARTHSANKTELAVRIQSMLLPVGAVT